MAENISHISWPGWETTRLIGRGSFGAVYEIQRDVFGEIEKSALKVISIPQNNSDIEELYSDGYDEESITSTFQSHLKSIVAEYTLMRKMNGSANIVSCDDVRYVQHEDGIGWDIFIKMELLTPLSKVLSADINEDSVIKIAKDMCTALELCSEYNIVHRDIKPQNIFVSKYGDYKLGDFGIAKTIEKTMGGTKIGTYKYMAPEVHNSQPYGKTADIYSLGLVLYWLLNERRMPFLPLPPAKLGVEMEELSRTRRFSGEPLPPPAHGSEKLKRIVLKACAFNPKDRYQSAAEMLADLNGSAKPEPPKPEPPKPEPPKSEPPKPQPPVQNSKKKYTLSVRTIVPILCLVILLIVVGFRKGHDKEDPIMEANSQSVFFHRLSKNGFAGGIDQYAFAYNGKYYFSTLNCIKYITEPGGASQTILELDENVQIRDLCVIDDFIFFREGTSAISALDLQTYEYKTLWETGQYSILDGCIYLDGSIYTTLNSLAGASMTPDIYRFDPTEPSKHERICSGMLQGIDPYNKRIFFYDDTRIGVYHLDSGSTTWLDLTPFSKPVQTSNKGVAFVYASNDTTGPGIYTIDASNAIHYLFDEDDFVVANEYLYYTNNKCLYRANWDGTSKQELSTTVLPNTSYDFMNMIEVGTDCIAFYGPDSMRYLYDLNTCTPYKLF